MMSRRATLIAEVDPAELAIRMCEASYGLKRPTPNAATALAAMDEDCRDGWLRAADAALHFIQECLASAQKPS
jgi:hypothetical protein